MVAMAGLSGDDLAAFVEESCVRSGVPRHVNDAAVMSRVAVLLLGGPSGRPSGLTARSGKATGVEGEHGDGDVSLGWAV